MLRKKRNKPYPQFYVEFKGLKCVFNSILKIYIARQLKSVGY